MSKQFDQPALLAIRALPTTFHAKEPTKIHESVFRCYMILNEVKRLLELGTPGSVVLELIKLMEYQEQDNPPDSERTAKNS